MKRLDGKSLDIVNENVTKLKELFPEVFSEGKIDFKKLEEELGQIIDPDTERYNFTWAGKTEAKRIAQTPSTGTLRPSKEDSKNWDTTQNLYIEGDNLEVLKLLQKSYHKKVKMIYIDPPYNTGKDFVYKDNFRDNIKNYMQITGQVDSEGNKLSTNSETSGRYHSDWLNMMYPRLKLARNLLKDDGVIFISIDDNEVANLRKLCDEIFGEDNYIQEIIWEKKFSPQNDAKYFSFNHEQLLCYAKNKTLFQRNLLPMTDEQKARYKNPDNDPRGVWQSGDLSVVRMTIKDRYEIELPNGEKQFPTEGRSWGISKEKFEELKSDNRIWFGSNGSGVPRLKRFLSEIQQGIVPISIFYHSDVGHTQEASKEIKAIFDDKKYFDYPKPVRLLKQTLHIGTNENDIILDFFSGSATTAHAVMKLNSEDGGNRKFICVQLPETTNESSEAYKAGYKNICEIGKERIRRAGEKIITDNSDKDLSELDIGFKVLKLDSSNIKAWDSDFENLADNLVDAIDNIKSDRSPEDLLYEVLLKYGLDLTLPIEEKVISSSKVYVIGFGALIVCFDDHITLDTVKQIAKLKEEYASEITRVVFKDSSFANAVVKTNALQTLKQFGIDEVVSI
jgi:adenine-specific DNA-methyltransferase